MKQIRRITAAAMAMLMLVGCAENPDSDIVVHKDMDKVISEAQQTDTGKQDVEELRQFDSYTADFENESLRVKVHADAQVDIPQTDKLSIFRVKQHEFTQAEVDAVRAALLGDTEVCDGILFNQITKKEIEEKIARWRAQIAEEGPQIADEENRAVFEQEMQGLIDDLQEQYESAPDEQQFIPSDGKLQSVAEMYAQNPTSDYWKWQDDLHGKEVIELRNLDNTAVLYAQNNPNYSNKICYNTSPIGTERYGGVTVDMDSLEPSTFPGLPENCITHGYESADIKLQQMPGDSCELSRAEAEAQAEALLSKIGIADFACASGDKYTEIMQTDTDPLYYRTCWIFRYYRSIGGVLLDQASGMKYIDGWKNNEYRKQMWPGESIELYISDAGIVKFIWNAPLEIVETVVDSSALKPFSEICDTFETMMPMVAATDVDDQQIEINIDRVTLTYSRISEKDSFDTGLIIPVWGFVGEYKDGLYYGGKESARRGVQMAVNAIDGSVIDGSLGY